MMDRMTPAFGLPDDEAGADFVVDGEEVELAAQRAVVAAFGFGQPLQVGVQFGLGLKGGAVDALEHGPVFVAAPVGAGGVQQLDGGNLAGSGDVGALAQVGKFAVAVDAQRGFVGQIVDDFLLEGLGSEHGLSGFAGQLFPNEGRIGLDGLQHQRLDAFQVLRRERAARRQNRSRNRRQWAGRWPPWPQERVAQRRRP